MRRRVVLASLLAALALTTLAWTAVADSADRFGTPGVQAGDRWVYDVQGVEGSSRAALGTDWRLTRVAFQAGGAVQSLDDRGEVVPGLRFDELRSYVNAEDADWTVTVPSWHAMASNGTPLASETVTQRTSSARNTSSGGVESTDSRDDIETRTVVSFGRLAPLCGFRHDRQDSEKPLKAGLTLLGACTPGGLDGPSATVVLPSAGRTSWNGRDVQVFKTDGLDAWLDAAIPVPVHLVLGNMTFDLVGYQPGEAPAAHAFPTHDVPALAFAARTPTGADERDVDHPFPLSAAFRSAEADPDAGLAEYLQAHPDAQVVAADFQERIQDTDGHREWTESWTFTASDGRSAQGVESDLVLSGPMGVSERPLQGPLDPGSLPPTTPPQPFPEPVQGAVEKTDAIAVDPVPGPWPSPSDLPAQVPTVASLLARWDAYKAPGRAPGQAWGFAFACQPTCADGHWRSWAGLSRQTEPFQACVDLACLIAPEPDISLLEVDGQGHPVQHTEVSLQKVHTFDVGLLAPASTPSAAPAHPAAVALPGPVTALGLAATVAALALLLWPWLKAGPLALFSRVDDGKVLDHPRRAALLAAIEAEPGVHLRGLARRLDLREGALRHHLDRLVAARKVRAVRGPRYVCYFPMRGVDARVAAVAPVLKSEVAREVLRRAAQGPGRSGVDLAEQLGVTPGAITYHVQRLAEAGLVLQRREGRELLVEATDLGRSAAMA